MSNLPAGTVTFVFTDIEGSSALWERSPTAMQQAVTDHDATITRAIAEHGGIIFKALGDGFACAFQDPADALTAVVAAQRALQEKLWPSEVGALRVRMAIHTGRASLRDGDYFGPTLNRTARLMSLAAGEQVLVSSASAALLLDALGNEIALRELGSYRLKDLALPETTFQVIAPGLCSDFPPIADVNTRPNNLPYQTSSFVGRDREVLEVRELLRDRRIVTLAGMGGIGKTRLALQVASETIDGFAHGAWFVDLSGLVDSALIEHSIAEALRIREVPQEPLLTTILTYLRERRLLLVIDNAEHLLSGVARAVHALTERCAGLYVLTTSREPLHIEGEHVYRVGPMSDSEGLFIERSQETSGHAITAADATAVETLCRKLGGIPLAIELAAARTTLLSVEQLDRRLGKGFDVLSSRSFENQRHGTLESTIDWSYQLLDEPEKRLFQVLSIFSDGFSLEACEAIGSVAVPAAPTLDLLQSLVEKSLVTVASSEMGPRYELLDTIREFAGKREPADEGDTVARAHLTFFLDLILDYSRSAKMEDRNRAATAISADVENIRAASKWAIENHSAQCGELIGTLAFYWQNHGKFTEGRIWLHRYLEAFSSEDAPYLRALRFAAFFAASQDDHDEAASLAARLLEIARARNDKLMAGEALHTMAGIEHRRGNLANALARYQEALDLFSTAGRDRNSLIALLNIVAVRLEKSETAGCEKLLDRADELAKRLGEDELTAVMLVIRGDLSLILGRFEEAETYARRALTLLESAGGARRAEALALRAEAQARRGFADGALESLRECIALSLYADEQNTIIRAFEVLAYVLFTKARYKEALTYYCSASYLRRTNGYFAQQLLAAREFERELRNRTGEAFDRAVERAPLESWRALAEQQVY